MNGKDMPPETNTSPHNVVAGVADPGPGSSSPATRTRPSRLWLWVVAAFALQAAAWTAWFIIASHHKVAEVPLAHAR